VIDTQLHKLVLFDFGTHLRPMFRTLQARELADHTAKARELRGRIKELSEALEKEQAANALVSSELQVDALFSYSFIYILHNVKSSRSAHLLVASMLIDFSIILCLLCMRPMIFHADPQTLPFYR
jgi:formate dehydrogenase maturation protein FdhE